MSLRIDPRAGSVELEAPLRAAGLDPIFSTLPAGDVEVWGRGPGGRPLLVGIEFKLIPDLLACVRSGRFAEQARGMRQRYEVAWLLVEGEWRLDGDALEVKERAGFKARGAFTYQEVASWLLTMAQRGGVLMWRTRDRAETLAWLRAMYWWWTSKDFEEHRAHLGWYTPPATGEALIEEPGLVQRVAAVLPGVGTDRARAAADHFPSVRSMVCADEAGWRAVDGVGPKTAAKIVAAVQ